MLVFTRRNGESFVLYPATDLDPNMTVAELFAAGPIEITVTDMKPHQVRIGIEAPPEILVYRSELLPITRFPAVSVETAKEA